VEALRLGILRAVTFRVDLSNSPSMETLLSDIKYGCIRNPVFSIVVVIALALGIGANTAIFSVRNAVLLKPLPYEDSAHLVNTRTDTELWGFLQRSQIFLVLG
jgi:protein-S-isoprenylcysteine O-methyltransferase Ste14